MRVWIIEPNDPLIARDGRPFGPVPGARAVSLAFPVPSTTTGAVRTRDGLDDEGRFRPSEIPRLKQVTVLGPLLVELDDETGGIRQDGWLAPAPADAVLFGRGGDTADAAKVSVRRLTPLRLPPGALTNLPDGLAPVGMVRLERGKPSSRTPRFWRWDAFKEWLTDARDKEDVGPTQIGHGGPVKEARMHVGIDPETKTADEETGALFQTQGLEFVQVPQGGKLSRATRLGLAVATDAPNLKPGIGPIGGERRVAFWRPTAQALPSIPDRVKTTIASQGSCRLVLLTPACFTEGWKPAWLLRPSDGVTPSLQAIAIAKPQVASGWSLELPQRAKPTRRLAPAGTVLFLKLAGDHQAIERWAERIWMQCVSDEDQDRKDGFGLAVLGTWDGQLREMGVRT
ncbi:MAG: type III-B CRISPR module-associated protein Cmr3 [Bacillota bacterium]